MKNGNQNQMSGPSPFLWIGILLLGLGFFLVFIAQIMDDKTGEQSILGIEPDLVMNQTNRTCYGFYNSEKSKGHNTTNWICDDGYIMHDPTGVVIPKNEVDEKVE